MLVEESKHVVFDETKQNVQESVKTGVDDEDPTRQRIDAELQNEPKKFAQLHEN